MTMEIFKGCLDDISRPASSEQTQSERLCPTAPFALVVLTNDAPADTEVNINSSCYYIEICISLFFLH